MQLPSSITRRRSSLELQMTPLIDVVFLLLVFFVWTASFQSPERWLPGSVSSARVTPEAGPLTAREPPPPEADFERVVVRLRWSDGEVLWLVNDQPFANLSLVQQQLVTIARIAPAVPVVLHPDKQVPLGIVIDAYDAARRCGFQRVHFAAQRRESS